MRYSKEFKLECVRKYKAREYIQDPGGCKHKTFYKKVNRWSKIYEQLGEAGLEHKKPKLKLEDKLIAIRRIENGESINSVANSLGRQCDLLSKWYKQYLQGGIDGLKSKSRKGRPPKVKKESKQEEKVLTPEEEIKKLKEELEMAKLENEYLKKLAALVQARKDQQQKKK